MPKLGVSPEAVWQMGVTLPGVEKSTARGSPALKLGGQLMVCAPTNRSAEPGSLVVRVDRNDRAHLLTESPDLYYVTSHYSGYDAVLMRLDQLSKALLPDILAMAHNFVTRKVSSPGAKCRSAKSRLASANQPLRRTSR